MNIDNTRFREFLLNIEFCKATVIYRTCTMPTILKLHFYQCLKSIVLSTWLLIHVLLQKFRLLYLVKNGNLYMHKKSADLNFEHAAIFLFFCSISVFIFLHFLTLCERPCTSHSWFQAIDLIWYHPLPSIFPRKKPIKMCFYSTCLSCFWKQILRPLFPWLISVDVPGRFFFF